MTDDNYSAYRPRATDKTIVAARQREVAAKYRRQREKKFGPRGKGPPPAVRLSDLGKIFAHREMNVGAEIDKLGMAAYWPAARLGELLSLRFEERLQIEKTCNCRIRTIAPIDVTPAQVAVHYRTARQERRNERKRAKRSLRAAQVAREKNQVGASPLAPRVAALIDALTEQWQPIPAIALKLEGHPAFLREAGELADPQSHRRAVRRAVDDAIGLGTAEELTQQRVRRSDVRLVRRKAPATNFSETRPCPCPNPQEFGHAALGHTHGRVSETGGANNGRKPDGMGASISDNEMASFRESERVNEWPHRILLSATTGVSDHPGSAPSSGAVGEAAAAPLKARPAPDDGLEIPEFLRRVPR